MNTAPPPDDERDTLPPTPDPVGDAVGRIEGKLDRLLAMYERFFEKEQEQDRDLLELRKDVDFLKSRGPHANGAAAVDGA